MEFDVYEWLNLLFRWFHVFAGILWIGSTYYFTWLDGRMEDKEENPDGVWMVHSGGFYLVKKSKSLQALPKKLHWFRWEAAFTWLSGVVLLVIVYYMGGLVRGENSELPEWQLIGLGMGLMVVAWFAYDALWLSPLGKNTPVGVVICYLIAVAVAFGLSKVMSGRSAYMHVGAMFGTLMAANVWIRILPAQRALIAATEKGTTPDLTLGARAKLRSKHNTFMIVPVVFIMLSSHYPGTYGAEYNWAILAVLIAGGWVVAKFIRE